MPIATFVFTLFNVNAFFFYFLSRGIRMDIPILTGVQKRHISSYKGPHNLLKDVLLKLYFQQEGHVDVIFLIYTLTFYCEFLLFHSFQVEG